MLKRFLMPFLLFVITFGTLSCEKDVETTDREPKAIGTDENGKDDIGNDFDGLGTLVSPYILPSDATDIVSPIAEENGERITCYQIVANCDSVMSISCDTLRKETIRWVNRHRIVEGGDSPDSYLENEKGMSSCDLFIMNQDIVTFAIVSPDTLFATNKFKISYREKKEGESFDRPIELFEGETSVSVVSTLLDRWYMVSVPVNVTLDMNIRYYEKYIRVYAYEDGILHKLENINPLPWSMIMSAYTYTNTNDSVRNIYVNLSNTKKEFSVNVAFTEHSDTILVKP